ncbi:RCC1 domain-containing protein [Agitococcus lubricus]|uniref:Regulator of chromosome condensation (RCC1) repeat-containing protein n=1 Tax=Agitococcus lubricus TaxID=1077255 RepID=A0A2T5IVI3_9GAMM|nr:RCC1 domain-containing protein [Agitococcus lubricus]PTQ87918.1 regulator of chromosome condensation (RCC1) repeat-containing protein [Agitococcus lubricus]
MRYVLYGLSALLVSGCIRSVYEVPVLGRVVAGQGDTRPFEQPLPINTQPKRLALGSDFAIGLKEDGTVWSWGSGSKGELGTGKQENREIPQAIPNMTNFLEVAVGSEHVLALRKDGTVWSWGDNKKGALGYKEEGVPYGPPNDIRFRPHQLTPKQIPELKDVVSIATGSYYSLALDKEGRVWGWGSGFFTFSVDEKFKQPTPKLIIQDERAVKVIGGGGGAYSYGLLRNTGEVKLSFAGKLLEPKFDAPVVDVVMIPGNSYFLLNTGRVYALGSNSKGGLAQRAKAQYETPLLINALSRIIKIDNFTALDEKGRVWQWGGIAGISIDQIFTGNNQYAQYYPKILLNNKKIVDIYCCTMAFEEDGTVWAWSNDTGGRRGDAKPVKGSMREQTHQHWTTPVRSLWTWK